MFDEWVFDFHDLHTLDRLADIAHLLKGDSQNLGDKVRSVLERTRQLEKELQQLKEHAAAQESANLSSKAVDLAA